MGASCSHEKVIVKDTIQDGKTLLTNKKIVIYECQDCGGTVAKEMHVGRLTSAVYSSKDIDKHNCDHKYFEVDDATVRNRQESTLATPFIGMLTGRLIEPKRNFSEGVATCKVCKAQFRVQSNFHTESYWENKVVKSREIHDEWKICTKKVATGQTRDEIDYVYKK